VVISDEGVGFIEKDDSSLTPGFGLEIMHERAEAVGGKLTVQSEPGQGTQVIVQLPRLIENQGSDSSRGLRVLLVDDHPLYLEGMRNMLSTRGVQVIGTARDGLTAVELARQLLPDLILMDVEMPQLNGLEATRRIKAELFDIKIVILTIAADDDTLFEALKHGASGYLLKNLDSRQFFSLLTDVMRGETVLSPPLAARVLTEFARRDTRPAEQDEAPALTPRQQEVLELAAQGLTNKEIAAQLHVTVATVKYHIAQILERLQLKSRHELAQYAQPPSSPPD
jgi:DNA-binding NarL/FixJ family response regulator